MSHSVLILKLQPQRLMPILPGIPRVWAETAQNVLPRPGARQPEGDVHGGRVGPPAGPASPSACEGQLTDSSDRPLIRVREHGERVWGISEHGGCGYWPPELTVSLVTSVDTGSCAAVSAAHDSGVSEGSSPPQPARACGLGSTCLHPGHGTQTGLGEGGGQGAVCGHPETVKSCLGAEEAGRKT